MIRFKLIILFCAATIFLEAKNPITQQKWDGQVNEFPIDTSVFWTPSDGDKWFMVDVVKSESFYFVAWMEKRSFERWEIYGTRLDSNGAVLDPAGILIASIDNWPLGETPAVATDGTNFMVVWSGYTDSETWRNIVGVRINPNGEILDETPLPIAVVQYHQWRLDIAFDGSNYFVVWQDDRNQANVGDIYGSLISPEGIILTPDGIPICNNPAEQYGASVAFDGENYLVVWTDYRSGVVDNYDIYGTRVTTSGEVLDPEGIPICMAYDYQASADVIFGNTNYFVVWSDKRKGNWDIYGARVDPNGTVIDYNGIIVNNVQSTQQRPKVAFNGAEYFVVWQDARDGIYWEFYATFITDYGVVEDLTGFPLVTDRKCETPSLIAVDTTYFLAWPGLSDIEIQSPQIFGTRVSNDAILIDGVNHILSTSANKQTNPALLYANDRYLAVWEDNRLGPYGIFGRILTGDGSAVTETFRISYENGSNLNPAVAWNGSQFLVAWENHYQDSTAILVTRVDVTGTILDTEGIIFATPNEQSVANPVITSDGFDYIVMWEDYWYDFDWWVTYSSLYARRISSEGVILDSEPMLLASDQYGMRLADAAFDETNYLIIWRGYDVYGDDAGIIAKRIDPNGTIIDSDAITITSSSYGQFPPSIDFIDENYMIVWEDYRMDDFDIIGCRLSKDGIVLDSDGFIISGSDENQWHPAISFNGNDFVIVWEDFRNGTSYRNIFGTKVSPDGTVLDSIGTAISETPISKLRPAVSSDQSEMSFVIYQNFVSEDLGTYRTYGIILDEDFFSVIDEYANILNKLILHQNYPNPFNPATTIHFDLPEVADVELIICDILGREVERLVSGQLVSGVHEVVWDASNEASGVYFYRLITNNSSITKKMVLLK